MTNQILLYTGAVLPFLWGIAHLFPTRSVVRGFGDISLDNKRIIAMEWILEGVTLIFIGIFVSVVTYIDYESRVGIAVYWISICALITFAIVSLFTGFKVAFLPFKLCPVIFAGTAVLILVGAYI
jgi:hypothetical protein